MSTVNPAPGLSTATLDAIVRMPGDFHEAGALMDNALRAIARHAAELDIRHSAETGCGKSTLLLSWLSGNHTVFTLDAYDGTPCRSLQVVQDSALLHDATVNFIIGPSQQTVPAHHFSEPLQLVLIDGPHAFPFPQLEYYHFYPRLAEGALLIIDDIHIPTITWLHDFLCEDRMFELLEIVDTTAFFRRTGAPLFDPLSDGWWLQNYNQARFVEPEPRRPSLASRVLGRIRRSFANR